MRHAKDPIKSSRTCVAALGAESVSNAELPHDIRDAKGKDKGRARRKGGGATCQRRLGTGDSRQVRHPLAAPHLILGLSLSEK